MASVEVTQPRPDHLVIAIGRQFTRAGLAVGAAAFILGGVGWLTLETVPGVLLWVVALMTVPVCGVAFARAMRRGHAGAGI